MFVDAVAPAVVLVVLIVVVVGFVFVFLFFMMLPGSILAVMKGCAILSICTTRKKLLSAVSAASPTFVFFTDAHVAHASQTLKNCF